MDSFDDDDNDEETVVDDTAALDDAADADEEADAAEVVATDGVAGNALGAREPTGDDRLDGISSSSVNRSDTV